MRFPRSSVGCFGAVILSLAAVMSMAAPWIAPHDPIRQDIGDRLQPPGRAHLLGTDSLGIESLAPKLLGTELLGAELMVAELLGTELLGAEERLSTGTALLLEAVDPGGGLDGRGGAEDALLERRAWLERARAAAEGLGLLDPHWGESPWGAESRHRWVGRPILSTKLLLEHMSAWYLRADNIERGYYFNLNNLIIINLSFV